MSATPLYWHRLRWPREVAPEQVVAVFHLLATTAGQPVVIQAMGTANAVEHHLALPGPHAEGVVEQLRAALPGLAVETLTARPPLAVTHALTLRLSTRRRPLSSDDAANTSRALLTALADVRSHERLVVQWVLGRPLRPRVIPDRLEGMGRESWLGALLLAPLGTPPAADAETRHALRVKQGEPGWQVAGRLGVMARTPGRERQLLAQLLGALRSAEAPGVSFAARITRARYVSEAQAPRLMWPLRLNASELASVSAWPVGLTNELPVVKTLSRPVAPARAIPRRGRVLGEATFPGRERPVALSPNDALRHLHLLGPTGSGKSTLLLNLITQELAAGRAVVVIEPKGDLIDAVLERVPLARLGDVVLLDPTDRGRPVGLNPLAPAGRSPELVADQLLGLFHTLYAAHWGPRTQDILGASLLTLARTPGMTLAALPLLLTDAGFRRRVVPNVSDPIGLAPFWRSFEAWREPERLHAIAPVMNKLRPVLLRPDVRAIIGQAEPRFALRQVFTERKLLLVNLAAGQVGPETSALLGSLVISQLWQAILGRSAVPPERRHPVSVVLDEFQTFLDLPLDLADALAQARGLGAGFVLAHQYLHQLGPEMRAAVLANAQSRIAFRLASDDARTLSADGNLAPEDFQGLGAFEAYAQLVAGSAVQPWCSLRSLPPGPPTSSPAVVRTASRLRYGRERATVENEVQQLVTPERSADVDDLTPRKRGGEQRP